MVGPEDRRRFAGERPTSRWCWRSTWTRSARERITAYGVRTVATLDEALADDAVEAVVLCTPHRLHAEQIVAAAAAGRHVFCEKPLTTSRCRRRARDRRRARGRGAARDRPRTTLRAGRAAAARRCAPSGALGTPLRARGQLQPGQVPRPARPTTGGCRTCTRRWVRCPPPASTSSTWPSPCFGRPTEVWARLGTHATRTSRTATPSPSRWASRRAATALITAILTTPFDGRVRCYGSKGVGGDPRPQAPREPARLGRHHGAARRRSGDAFHPRARACATTWRPSRGRRAALEPYPVSLAEMQANVEAFEAITRSARSGLVEPVG